MKRKGADTGIGRAKPLKQKFAHEKRAAQGTACRARHIREM
jgi:hypothetical protein